MKDVKFDTKQWLMENLNVDCEVHYEMTPLGGYPLDEPRMASEKACKFCGSDQFLTNIMWPDVNHQRVRLCHNEDCVAFYPIKPEGEIKNKFGKVVLKTKSYWDTKKIKDNPELYKALKEWHKPGAKPYNLIYGE